MGALFRPLPGAAAPDPLRGVRRDDRGDPGRDDALPGNRAAARVPRPGADPRPAGRCAQRGLGPAVPRGDSALAGPSSRWLLRQPHGFEGLRLVVVVVDPRDLAVSESGDDGVLALDANATSAPSGPHNDERNDLIARVNEALKLHRVALEGRAPVRQPLGVPGEAVIGARIRDVVVVDLNLTVDDIPKRPTGPVEMVMESAGDFDVLLRHRPRSIPQGSGVGVNVWLRQAHGFEGFRSCGEGAPPYALPAPQPIDVPELLRHLHPAA